MDKTTAMTASNSNASAAAALFHTQMDLSHHAAAYSLGFPGLSMYTTKNYSNPYNAFCNGNTLSSTSINSNAHGTTDTLNGPCAFFSTPSSYCTSNYQHGYATFRYKTGTQGF